MCYSKLRSNSDDLLSKYGGLDKHNFNNTVEHFFKSEEPEDNFPTSHYFDIDSFSGFIRDCQNDFLLLSLNIECLNAKFDKLCAFLQMLADKNIFFSAIALQECWLSPKANIDDFAISGYHKPVHQEYICGQKGGLVVYILEKYDKPVKRNDLYVNSKWWEGLFVDISHEDLPNKITIGNVYRPPRDNYSNPSIDHFLIPIAKILKKLSTENSLLQCVGDYNIDLLQSETREKFQEYFDMFLTHGLMPQITLPPRFSKKRATLIDQIFTRPTKRMTNHKSGIIVTKISDHLPCFSSVTIPKLNKKADKFVTVRENSAQAIDLFNKDIEEAIKNTHFDTNLLNDPNNTYQQLHNIIQTSKEDNLPTKTKKFNRYKHKISPWITNGIMTSIKQRDRLYKHLQKIKSTSIKFQTETEKLQLHCSILQKSVRNAKAQYYNSIFNKYKSDIKQTWKHINQMLNRNSSKSDFPKYFLENGKMITDDTEIANCFNNFFLNVGPDLSNKIKAPKNQSYKNFLSNQISSNFAFEPVTVDLVKKIINNLKSKISFGHDGISSTLLQKMSDTIVPTLTLIINQSLCTGIFPDQLKIAKIKPIYKKEDPHLPDNYRPISLLPAISKIFEKVAYIQVYKYFTDNKLFYKSQYGFRQLHSTELAALEITDKIYIDLDNKKIPLAIFLDLSKAFDTIDHDILLYKLNYYGIKGIALNWFKSYLTNRKQYVEFNGKNSKIDTISTGVPQGSILGPLLFIIYMNDISKVTDKFHFTLYADDTSLNEPLCTFTPQLDDKEALANSINNELSKICDWLALNKLSLNVKKTKMMVFHYRQRFIKNIIPKLMINNIPIEHVKKFNFLGIVLDECMTWDAHINKISSKIAFTIYTMKRIKKFIPSSILLTIYNSLILPYINYGILTWGHKRKRITRLQKWAVRTITSSQYTSHTESHYRKLKLLKVKDIHHIASLKFHFKYTNQTLPEYFHTMFDPIKITHNYGLRDLESPHLESARTKSSDFSIRYAIPPLLKRTPQPILDKMVSIEKIQNFSKFAKKYFVSSYTNICTNFNCYVCKKNSILYSYKISVAPYVCPTVTTLRLIY